MRPIPRLFTTAAMGLVLFACTEQDNTQLRTQLREAAPLRSIAPDRSIDPTVLQSISYLKNGQYKEASQLLNRRLQEEPTNATLHILNGITYERLAEAGGTDQLELAIVGYESALNVDPNNVLALTQLGQLQYKKKEFDKSQELFANALLLKPDDSALLHELAAASYYAYDLKTAQAAIQKVVEDQPEDLLAQRSATMIYAALGDFTTAKQHFEKYHSLAGEDPDVDKVSSRLEDWQDLYSSGRIHLAQTNGGGNTFDPFQSPNGDSTGDTEPQISGLAEQALSTSLSEAGDGGNGDDSGSGGDGSSDGGSNGSAGDGGGGNGSASNGNGSGTQTSPSSQSSSSSALYDESTQLVVDCYLLRIFENTGTSKGNNILRNLEVSLSPGGYLFGTSRTSGSGTISKGVSDPNSTTFTGGSGITMAPGAGAVQPLDGNSQPQYGSFTPDVEHPNKGRISFSTFAAALTWRGLSYNLNIANVNDNRSEVVARPSLLTFVGKESVFFSGDELVIGLSGENGSNLIKYPVGITLVVKPSSLKNGVVTLDISVEGGEFNDPNPLQQDLTQTVSVGKTRIDTHAKVRLGETLALGGIYERAEAQSKDGFPGLSALPIAQYFFSNEQTQSSRRSVVILMTPRSLTKTRQDLEKRIHEKSDPPSLAELKDQNKDWFDTTPNLVKIFTYLSVDPVIYYSMQNADILPPSWGSPDAHYNNDWEKTLNFLYY